MSPLSCVHIFLLLSRSATSFDCEPTGGCILNTADEANVPASSPYIVSEIVTNSNCAPFQKHLRAYGILLVANTDGQAVPDEGLKWIAHAITELFPAAASDQAGQRKILEAMFRYRAANPIFQGKFVDKMSPARDYLSLCDSITIEMSEVENNSGQLMEVYEHLLHIITDVGLHHAFPARWGVSKTSDLYKAMQEAISAGAYDVTEYAKVDEEARPRLELQEFAYWGLSTVQGMHARFFDGSAAPEWTLSTANDVRTKLPLFWALHADTTAKWMGVISDETLTQVGNLAPGKPDAATAPWPIDATGRGDVPGDVVGAGVCKRPQEESQCATDISGTTTTETDLPTTDAPGVSKTEAPKTDAPKTTKPKIGWSVTAKPSVTETDPPKTDATAPKTGTDVDDAMLSVGMQHNMYIGVVCLLSMLIWM